MKLFKKGQGATEYLLMLAAVLVIVAIAVWYVTGTGGYPAVAVTAVNSTAGHVKFSVSTGSIPANEWEYKASATSGGGTWTTGAVVLTSASIEIDDATVVAGTLYVSLRHKSTGHLYFSDQAVTVT